MILGLATLVIAFRSFGMKRKIEDTPTSKVESIAAGIVELNGTAIPRESLMTPYSRRPCVYYEYRMEELQAHREFNPMTKRWMIVREWVQLAAQNELRRFYLQDETGKVLVDPTGAQVPESKTYQQWFLGRRRRHTERAIFANSKVYLLGTAAENPENRDSVVASDLIMIRKGDISKEFILTSESEKQIEGSYLLSFLISLLVGIAFLGLGAWMIIFP